MVLYMPTGGGQSTSYRRCLIYIYIAVTQQYLDCMTPLRAPRTHVTLSGAFRPPLPCPQILTFVKVFHWLVQDRVDYMETTPATSRLAHLRIVSFMAVLLVGGWLGRDAGGLVSDQFER